jgi:hypothetical protein
VRDVFVNRVARRAPGTGAANIEAAIIQRVSNARAVAVEVPAHPKISAD